MSYRAGDHWLLSDRSGKKIRASESVREWNGSIVHRSEHEPRHPQEYVRSTLDRQTVATSRPRGVDTFIGPLKTEINATHVPGTTTITVLDSSRFGAGDAITIMLEEGDAVRMTVLSVPGATSLTLTEGLPGSTNAGKAVVNHSAVAEATLE